MSKSLLGISMDVVNGIWSAGTETYKVAKNEVNEAENRTRKALGEKADDSDEFARVYAQEREKVEKDVKELALKGGLLAVGLGVLF